MQLEIPGSAEDRVTRRADMPRLIAAASVGDVEAQLALAWEYARGDVLKLDMAEALHWFDTAAATGQRSARSHRARFLQLRHVPEGVRVLRKLAAEGDQQAQFWLAQYLQTMPDRVSQLRAVVWFERSYKNGNPSAKLAGLRQLATLAPQPLKPVFVVRAMVATIAFALQLLRQDRQKELMKPLFYKLNSGKA